MTKVLVIDDEEGIRNVLTDILEDENYRVLTAADGLAGLEMLERELVDVVILDVWLPRMGGIEVLKAIKEKHPEIEVIIISGHANIDLAVKAVKLGAFDFMEKPLSLEKIITLVRNARQLELLRRENAVLKSQVMKDEERIIGNSPSIQKVMDLIEQSAGSDARILISGENGTGKELVARAIHAKSQRKLGPFVEVNCAAIPENLIESELFGHEKGAFTGAVSSRKGKFEIAHGGTLFLDEVADMSLAAQAKMLRAIQELKFERVGGEDSIKVDVRLIAATNKSISAEVSAGRFREDLFFRLNVIPVHVPALRDRRQDIPALLDHFLKASDNNRSRTFEDDAMEYLKNWQWPGNVRELKNFVERVTIMTDESRLGLETVQFFLGAQASKRETKPAELPFLNMPINEAKDAFERTWFEEKLKANNGDTVKTAEELGMYPGALLMKLKKLGVRTAI